MILKIFVDGGARGNPGPGAMGVVIKNQQDKIVDKFGKELGVCTNNIAEYKAVIEALEYLLRTNNQELTTNLDGINFFSDSQLLVSQLSGVFKVKNPKIRELVFKIRQLEQEVGGNVSYGLIPREENRLADSLVNKALDE